MARQASAGPSPLCGRPSANYSAVMRRSSRTVGGWGSVAFASRSPLWQLNATAGEAHNKNNNESNYSARFKFAP